MFISILDSIRNSGGGSSIEINEFVAVIETILKLDEQKRVQVAYNTRAPALNRINDYVPCTERRVEWISLFLFPPPLFEKRLKERRNLFPAEAQSHPEYKAAAERRLRRRGAQRTPAKHQNGSDDYENENVQPGSREWEQRARIEDHPARGRQKDVLHPVIDPCCRKKELRKIREESGCSKGDPR